MDDMKKIDDSEFEMAVAKNKGKQTTINSPARHATIIEHWHLFVGQWDSKKGLLRLTKRLRTVDAKLLIFRGQSAMDDARRASPADTKLDRGRVRMGLGEELGVLLPGVTASFLSNDAFGHNDGNRAIFDCKFC